MCEACDLTDVDPEIRKKAHENLLRRAEEVGKLARKLHEYAYGNIKPHSDEAKLVGVSAKSVIRQLVEDWL